MFVTWESVLLKGTVNRNVAVIKACVHEMGDYPVLNVEDQNDDNADLVFLDYYAYSSNPGMPPSMISPAIRARICLTQLDNHVCELQITDDNPDRIWREKLRAYEQAQNPGASLSKNHLSTDEDQLYYEFREALMTGLHKRGSIVDPAHTRRYSNKTSFVKLQSPIVGWTRAAMNLFHIDFGDPRVVLDHFQ